MFEVAGFDDYECLLSLMHTETPLTHEILSKIGVSSETQRRAILKQLCKDCKEVSTELVFDSAKAVSCGTCLII